ncbi:MAG: peptidyl-prolyl cis-trans isomerase [Rhodobacteraceae bacterium]|nr:peptidyl-prolyl cis-trans isomerase [Paracoccaceae bacterium]
MSLGFKSKAAKNFGGVIVILLIAGLAGFGATNFGGNVRSIGAVGETEISVPAYGRELQQELQALAAQTGQQFTLSQAQAFGIDIQVRQRLLAEAAFEEEARLAGLSVGDASVRRQIVENPGFQGLDGQFDRAAYEDVLVRNGMSVREYEADIRSNTASTILQGALVAGLEPPQAYGDAVMNWLAERRNFTWVAVSPALIEEPLAEPTDAELRAYFDENADAYTLPETKRITYAWLLPEFLLDEVETDEATLRALYDERSDEYNVPERRLVERLIFGTTEEANAAMERLNGGTSFETIVEDRGLSLVDVDMGDVTKASLGSAGDAVFALEEPGVAGPAETDLGPAIFRVNGILAARETPFEDVRDELADELATESARRMIGDRIEGIDDLLASGATLEELASETAMQMGSIDWYPGVSEGIAAYAAFGEPVNALAEGDFPEVLELEDGGIFAMRLEEVLEPRLQSFETVREEVIAGWEAQAMANLLRSQAEALQARVDSGEAIDTLGLQAIAETDITRDDFIEGPPARLIETVFEMEKGKTRIVEGEDQVALVLLEDILPPDSNDPDVDAIRERLNDATIQAIARDILGAFVADVQQDAGISLNQAAINAVHAQFP